MDSPADGSEAGPPHQRTPQLQIQFDQNALQKILPPQLVVPQLLVSVVLASVFFLVFWEIILDL